MFKKTLSLFICLLLLFSALSSGTASADDTYTVAEIENLCGGIAAYKEAACGASSVQEWIDTRLCDNAGTVAEFYVIALSQSGSYDFSRYEQALLDYIGSHEVYSATTREKYALALLACGSTDGYIRRVCDSDIGGQGLMSLVFGLHLLNNGCTSALYTVDALIADILAAQLDDGGWAVIGNNGDPDVTAMTIQALAPYNGAHPEVTASIGRALTLLSVRQLDSGGFKSMGKENCESAAQVLTALSSLGIDPDTDSRFIKNGCSVMHALIGCRNADGSFAHTEEGFSESATMQAFYALRAHLRMRYGQTPLYILDRRPAQAEPTEPPTAAPTQAPSAVPSPTVPFQTSAPSSAPATEQRPLPGSVSPDDPTDVPTQPPYSEASSPAPATFQPAGTQTPASTADEVPEKGGYKLYAVIGILAAALIACAVLLLRKKRSLKHYLAVVILAAGAIIFVLLTNFESKESYARVGDKAHPVGGVTMTISCGVLSGEDGLPDAIPESCVILPETTFSLGDGESVYDILLEASRQYDIRIDNRGTQSSAYIAGIQFLYEYDYGSLSGWMYRVNGEFPDAGCQAYRLKDGDRIEWLYTRNIGKDLSP